MLEEVDQRTGLSLSVIYIHTEDVLSSTVIFFIFSPCLGIVYAYVRQLHFSDRSYDPTDRIVGVEGTGSAVEWEYDPSIYPRSTYVNVGRSNIADIIDRNSISEASRVGIEGQDRSPCGSGRHGRIFGSTGKIGLE